MTPRLTPLCLAISLALGAVTGAGCGSKESSGPAVVPGAAAGDVREVTGTVTAQRGDEPARPLAVGDVVSGDDLIKTEANSSIVIELRHNGVRWSLAAQHAKRLGDSAAWKAPKRGEGGATGERSTAAGRHAEREAADTAATAESAAPVPIPPPEPTPAAPAPEPKQRATRDAPKPAGGGGQIDRKVALDEEDPLGGGGENLRPLEKKAVAKVTARLGNASSGDAKKVIAQKLGSLKACWTRAVEGGATGGGSFAVSLTVDAEGKVTDVDSKADAAVEPAASCLVSQFEAMTFPAGSEGVVTATLVFGLE